MSASASLLGVQLDRLNRTATRIETLHSLGHLVRRDVESVYEGLYIRSLTALEGFIEDLFFDIMLRRARYPVRRGVVPKIEVRTDAVLYKMLKPGRSHLDWLPFEYTRERAQIYLREGRPFCELDRDTVETIYKWTVVRNQIAHDSREAKDKFEQHIAQECALPPRSRNPVGYLRQQIQVGPDVRRFRSILEGMAGIAKKLSP